MPNPSQCRQSRIRSSFSGHSVSVARRAPRALHTFWVALASALTLALLSPAFAHGQLFLDAFDPPIASPGAAVTLHGSGFVADPDAHAAFAIDPTSDAGALFDLGSATTTRLDGVLGAVAEPFTGQVRAWSGTCWELPGGLHRGEWATYLVQEAEWFVPLAQAQAPGEMVVTDSSPGTRSALCTGHSLIIPFEDWPTGGGSPEGGIDLDILVDGGTSAGDDGIGGAGGPEGDGPAGRILRVAIGVVEKHMTYDPVVLVADLANILESTYGALGMHFAAVGTDLHVTWDGAPTLGESLAVLSPGKGP